MFCFLIKRMEILIIIDFSYSYNGLMNNLNCEALY